MVPGAALSWDRGPLPPGSRAAESRIGYLLAGRM